MSKASAQSEKMKSRTGISYCRVSTMAQVNDKDGFRKDDASPEVQKDRCIKQAEYLGQKTGSKFTFLEHITDEGLSGKDDNRPGYQKMWNLIGAGKIDFIISTELSRLSRSVLDFLELVKHCEEHKVDVFIIGLDLDTSTPFGRVLVVILVALAQFEREMTSMRVSENILSRLLNDGKINGAAEILGLDRDPEKRGHFLVNEEELINVEKILKMFVVFSSKAKVLEAAKKMGLTGKKGRELTAHTLDIMLENVKWRYRGLWYANKDNSEKDQESLPETKRFQTVPLPHGPLLESELLDKVEAKLKDTYLKKKRTGRDNWIYLLSHVLYYEDGTRFQGQPGKDCQYRYYYNKNNRLRIRCDEIDPVVAKRVKDYFLNKEIFAGMVDAALKKRQTELPKIDNQITQVKKVLKDLQDTENELKVSLLDKPQRDNPNFMAWLESQFGDLERNRKQKYQELESLDGYRNEILDKARLEASLAKGLKEFVDGFDELSGTERRNLLGRIVKRITVKKDNKLEIELFGEPPSWPQRKKSTGSEGFGAIDGDRTRDMQSHNLPLYQLSYDRHKHVKSSFICL
jgi:DNA invertase Pin-like site-specific DNA recombinase